MMSYGYRYKRYDIRVTRLMRCALMILSDAPLLIAFYCTGTRGRVGVVGVVGVWGWAIFITSLSYAASSHIVTKKVCCKAGRAAVIAQAVPHGGSILPPPPPPSMIMPVMVVRSRFSEIARAPPPPPPPGERPSSHHPATEGWWGGAPSPANQNRVLEAARCRGSAPVVFCLENRSVNGWRVHRVRNGAPVHR